MSDTAHCRTCSHTSKDNPDIRFIKDKDSDTVLCANCITKLNNIITGNEKNETPSEESLFSGELPDPQDIYNTLNKHIIKQDEAKKQLSISIAQHFRRLKDPSIGKSNILIIGPTGTGKTEMARVIAKELKLNFLETKITNITSRGYVGDDVESIIQNLFHVCNWNKEETERGIVFIDEIDKIASSQNESSSVNNKAVQQELLKIMEGTQVKVKKGNGQGAEEVFVDTKNILFICAGAFEGLRLKNNIKEISILNISPVNKDTNELDPISFDQLKEYGLIPEFLGRLPIITETLSLNEEDLFKILVEPENSLLQQYQKLFKMDSIDLRVSNSYLKELSKEAFSKKLGARGLRQMFEAKTKDLFFNLNKYKDHIVTLDTVIKYEPKKSLSSFKI